MVIFPMFFLVCKLNKLGIYVTTYFGHAQCFIWVFLVLAFTETARLSNTSFSNFSWLEILVCKLCHACKSKLLFWTCPKFGTICILIGSYLQLLLNILYHRSTAIVFGIALLNTFWRLWKLLFFVENIFKIFSYLVFYRKISNFHNSGMVSHRELLDPSIKNIFNILLIAYNTRYHLNHLTLFWSAVFSITPNVFKIQG